MKHLLLSTLLLVLPNIVSAETVEIKGIYYELNQNDKFAVVTKNPNMYSGNIEIPDSISCDGIDYIVISIGNSAFRNANITSVSIPSSVTEIQERAFQDCSGITSIYIPENVRSIGIHAFTGCTGLTSIVVDSNNIIFDSRDNCNALINSITGELIRGCNNTTIIPNGVITIGDWSFMNCSELSAISLPNSLTGIGLSAFAGCDGLTSVSIPDNVTYIDGHAFSYCTNLTTVFIPSSVTSIGYGAFFNSSSLNSVYCYAETIPSTEKVVFSGIGDNTTLHVPASSIDIYSNTVPWNDFDNIVAIEGTEIPENEKCAPPTISYENGQLFMSCETEGVEFVTEITDEDVKKHYDATITLTATYTISAFATKTGYDNSDVATATLCYIEADPSSNGITTDIINIPTRAVLIQNNGGVLSLSGLDTGTAINVYNTSGAMVGSATASTGVTTINTSLSSGEIAIVKIGQKSIKLSLH